MNVWLLSFAVLALILIPLAPQLVRLRIRFFKWINWKWAVRVLEDHFQVWVVFFRILLFAIAAVLLFHRMDTVVDEHNMTESNPGRLKRLLAALALIYVMTFVSGFLQATQFNFVNYIFFFLLFMGGIRLASVTGQSTATAMAKGSLLLTSVFSVLLGLFFVAYDWSRLAGLEEREASLEGLLYLLTLLFWIAVVGSWILLRKQSGLESARA